MNEHHRHPGLALAVLACAQLMVILDATIVNVALPTIKTALHFSPSNLEWVITAYSLTFGGLLLFGGRTGDLYGKRRMFMIGIAVFAGASLLCGLATGETWLIITRGLQGIGGAIASPTALSLVAINFAEGPERNRAMGIYSAMSAVGGALGLLLGGILTSYVSWRWIFFVNVPIGALGLVLAPRVLEESRPEPGALDVPGAVTATAGMLSLVYGLTNASLHPWSSTGTVVPLIMAAVLLTIFIAIELRAAAPLMPLSIFRNRNRSGAYGIMMMLGVAVLSLFFFLTLYLQSIKGWSAVHTGLGFLPMSFGIMIAAVTTARLIGRVGIRPFLISGPIFALAGLILLTQITASSSYLAVVGPLVLIALGMGQCFVPLTVTVMAGVAPHEAGLSSALLNTGQQVGGALGLSILGTIAFSTEKRYLAHRHPLAVSMVHGYTEAFAVGAGLIGVAVAIALLVIRSPRPGEDPEPAPEALAHLA
ncbi:MAG TPA: MFS transporter [Acidimicrobiales bacterium]|jgi:EmrB/QacA subfamily drug resistance transporter|nr:MFS transporter [Acidimicrobiales bacterium]